MVVVVVVVVVMVLWAGASASAEAAPRAGPAQKPTMMSRMLLRREPSIGTAAHHWLANGTVIRSTIKMVDRQPDEQPFQ